ncbi:MAG TPA: hypothetical protein VK111_01610 [Virgibacillus sp.]|nr:hypothetical protein [Virgibacillus sp.]
MSDNPNPDKESDQEKELRELFSEVEKSAVHNHDTSEEKTSDITDETQKIDVLNLPPRREVHSNHSGRVKIKIRPYIRLIIVIILMIILFAGGFYLWGEELFNMIGH